jgi:putative hydrolase
MPTMDFSGAGGDFLQQLLGDLLGLMGGMPGGSSPARSDLARTLAQGVASGGQPEPNVDPAVRIELEQLARVADMHVTELTGMSASAGGTPVEVVAVAPGAWALQVTEDWRYLLEAMTEAAAAGPTAGTAQPGSAGGASSSPGGGAAGTPDTESATGVGGEGRHDPAESGAGGDQEPGLGLADLGDLGLDAAGAGGMGELVARFASTMGPMMAALQFGSAVGHLALSTLGQYEVPVPRSDPRLFVVPANLARFAEQWSIPVDEVRMWVAVRDLTVHAALAQPGVADRVRELLVAVVRDGAQDTAAMMQRLEGLDPSDPEALQRIFSDPESWMGDEPEPGARRSNDELAAAMAALLGYVDHVLDRAGSRLLGGHGALGEAWRRRQVAREPNERAAEVLLGLDLGPALADRGSEFVRGVLERAGDDGLARLWSSGRTLPTPAELDAPGLWLERIDIDA